MSTKEYVTINSNEVFSVDVSHIDCVGNCSIYIKMQDGSEVEIFGVSCRQVDQLEYNLTHPDMAIRFDKRMLTETEDQWLASNGIRR